MTMFSLKFGFIGDLFHIQILIYCVHILGYLHCDIACRNVLVSPTGVLKISDFGLARKIGSEECNLKGTRVR